MQIGVPKEIINKPGPLDHEEWAIMRRHTIEGQRMLDSVGGVLSNSIEALDHAKAACPDEVQQALLGRPR